MAINFPSNPADNERYVYNGKIYYYDASRNVWVGRGRVNASLPVTGNELQLAADIILPNGTEASLGTADQPFKDLFLSGNTLTIGGSEIGITDGKITTDTELTTPTLDTELVPENMEMIVKFNQAGEGIDDPWFWTWGETLLYGRGAIADSGSEVDIPIYRTGTYHFVNFAKTQYDQMTQAHGGFLKAIKGAGTQNLIPGTTITTESRSNPDNATDTNVEITSWTIPRDFSAEDITLVAPTVSYNVDASTGAYVFTGAIAGTHPTLTDLYRGGTYTFNLNVSGHPFYLTTDDGTNYASGNYVGEYTDGVVGSRNETGTLVFTVPSDAPDTLYYQCGVHGGMRGTINIKDLAVEELNDDDNSIRIYFQHGMDGHFSSFLVKDKPAIPTTACMMFNGTKFVPTHMNDYFNNSVEVTTKIGQIAQESVTTFSGDYDDLTNKPAPVTVPSDINELSDASGLLTGGGVGLGVVSLVQEGTLTVTTGTKRWYAPRNVVVNKIIARVDSASSGSSINITINKTTSAGATSNITMSIAAGAVKQENTSPGLSLAADDYLTIDITQIGSTNAGEDLRVTFTYS